MAMAGVPRRFAFFEVYFRWLLTRGENPRSGETTNPHFVRGLIPVLERTHFWHAAVSPPQGCKMYHRINLLYIGVGDRSPGSLHRIVPETHPKFPRRLKTKWQELATRSVRRMIGIRLVHLQKTMRGPQINFLEIRLLGFESAE